MKSIQRLTVSLIFFCFFIIFPKITLAAVYEASGWGWFGVSSGGVYATPGFVSFNCENLNDYYLSISSSELCGGSVRHDYNVRIDTDTGAINGYAWMGIASGPTISTTGWLMFSDDPNDYLYPNYNGTSPTEPLPSFDGVPVTGARYDSNGEVSGWARIISLAEYGYENFSGDNTWGWVKLRGDWDSGTESGYYGVTFDKNYFGATSTYGKFSGWAWSGTGSGLGQIRFDIAQTESVTGVPAWLQTLYGTIYSSGDITLSAPEGSNNATYLLLSNGFITAFNPSEYPQIEESNLLDFPENDAGVYRSNIGKIDLNSLNENATEIFSAEEINNVPLDNNIYKTAGNLEISNALVITNGVLDTQGNGTIVVNGDLTIKRDIQYSDSSVTDIRNLPSIAWIVTGKLTIDPNVQKIVGAFIVLGDGGIDTGYSNQELEVKGLMVAKIFNFQRIISQEQGEDIPAEKIIYDGRAIVNTPPGLEDLIKTLPELNIAQ